MADANGILRGVTVLDLSRVLAAPYCGMLLADMGADVIKVELPGRGDDSRTNLPIVGGESAYFMNLNRNKRGITLDLKHPKGKALFLSLVKQSDILIENFRPGVMERLGLGYEQLREVNPALVYGAISGFGHYGPYRDRGGYDILGQAMSGMMSTTGWPEGAPTRTGTSITDVLAGLSCCVGVLAAYINRLKCGEGEKVDVSLVDCGVSAMEIINMIYLCTGREPGRIGNRYEALYPFDSFRAKDGELVIACGNNKLFVLMSALMGQPELASDERFCTNNLRVANCAALKELVEAWLADKSIDEAVKLLLDAGVPAGPINSLARVVQDPHIAGAREMFVEVEHPTAGKMKLTGTQLKFSRRRIRRYSPAPLLGADTRAVLGEKLGLTQAQCDELEKDGVF